MELESPVVLVRYQIKQTGLSVLALSLMLSSVMPEIHYTRFPVTSP